MKKGQFYLTVILKLPVDDFKRRREERKNISSAYRCTLF